MSKTWYPIINEERCIECGACVNYCEHGVYKKGQDKPYLFAGKGDFLPDRGV
jgi:NAD-dependent dihydropyrimidine dehydrogenase PreA subunit